MQTAQSCDEHWSLTSCIFNAQAYTDGGSSFFEDLHTWPTAKIQSYLMAFNGLSGKSIACLLLYRMGRVAFAVDTNVLRVMTRLGWLKHLGINAFEVSHLLLSCVLFKPVLVTPDLNHVSHLAWLLPSFTYDGGTPCMVFTPRMVFTACASARKHTSTFSYT